MLVDTHCHLHDRAFFDAEQAEEMILRAHKNGVKKVVCIGTDPEDSLVARDFANQHKNVYWTYGVHPEEFLKNTASKFVKDSRLVAIGEVGLDYHSEGYNRKAQIKLFEEMLQLAEDNDLPAAFHVRDAFDDFFPVVANFPKVRGVVHSFTGSKKVLKKILEATDFFVGVNGIATYTTLPIAPLERIVLETDAPFLTPTPFRGIINEPGYVFNIAQWLSQKLEVDFTTIEKVTTENARRLYRFQDTDN